MITEISGGYYELQFSGSQFSYGNNFVDGTYQASVTLPTADPVIKDQLLLSSSLLFTPVWSSLDSTIGYVTGSQLTATPASRTGNRLAKNLVFTCTNVFNSYGEDEEVYVKLHIFDYTDPLIKLKKLPVEMPGIVLSNVHYQLRDAVTGEIPVPFDDVKNSTKVSSDATGMFFKFHTSSLRLGHVYAIDVMVNDNGVKTKHKDVSPAFRIENLYD
jgi:hypothetical protein